MWRSISHRGTGEYVVRSCALILLAAALLYLALNTFPDTDTIDFKYIYLAGTLWQDGVNPYSEAFKEIGQSRFTGMNRPQYMLYPPHWWGLAVTLAQTSYETAGQIWRVSVAACMIVGPFLLHRTVSQISGAPQPWRTWITLIFASTMSATAITLSLGQTSHLLFLGVCLFAQAYVSRTKVVMAVALTIVMLKPNFGLVMALFLLPSSFWWTSIAGGAAITLLLSLPALLPFGPIEVIRGYLHALGQWEALPPNTPLSTTGLRYLAKLGFGLDLPGTWFALSAAALSLFYGALLSRHRQLTRALRNRATALGLLLSGLALLVPLHTYDMMVLIPLLALATGLPARRQMLLFLLMLVTLRPNNIALALGLALPEESYFPGSGLVTVTILFITVLWVDCLKKSFADFRGNIP